MNDNDIPEASFAQHEPAADDSVNQDMLAQLQAKIKTHNETADNNAANPDGVWAGDPGDGTDFITVVDLPIEDQGAVPTYDMFDNPTTNMQHTVQHTAQPYMQQQQPMQPEEPLYDFTDLVRQTECLK